MLPESGCKSKKENLKSSRFRYITIYLTFIQNLFMQREFNKQVQNYEMFL